MTLMQNPLRANQGACENMMIIWRMQDDEDRRRKYRTRNSTS